jgi:hypothetical protein
VRYLLMGGQACVFYGAAEFSRDLDLDRAALRGDRVAIEAALEAEQQAERAADRLYWEPLTRELQLLRRSRRTAPTGRPDPET